MEYLWIRYVFKSELLYKLGVHGKESLIEQELLDEFELLLEEELELLLDELELLDDELELLDDELEDDYSGIIGESS